MEVGNTSKIQYRACVRRLITSLLVAPWRGNSRMLMAYHQAAGLKDLYLTLSRLNLQFN